MFLRVTNYQYPAARAGDIEAWVHTKTDEVRAFEGVVSIDVFEASPGEGVIVARYDDEAAFQAVSASVKAVLGELADFLTGPISTNSGTAFWSV